MPSPSWPLALSPQQLTVPAAPALTTAQADFPPAEMDETLVRSAERLAFTVVGPDEAVVAVVPVPNCPEVFEPQHFTPDAILAQANLSPAAMAPTPVRLAMRRGVVTLATVAGLTPS